MTVDNDILKELNTASKAFDRIDVMDMICNQKLSEGELDQESDVFRFVGNKSEIYYDNSSNEYLVVYREIDSIRTKRIRFDKKGKRKNTYYINYQQTSEKGFQRARKRC